MKFQEGFKIPPQRLKEFLKKRRTVVVKSKPKPKPGSEV